MKDKLSQIDTIDKLEKELEDCDFINNFTDELLIEIRKTLDPFEDKGYTYSINDATIVGLLTKLYKHFHLFQTAYKQREYETLVLLSRPIYEAFVIMKYLILKGESSQRHYRLVSYRRRYQNAKELEEYGGIGHVLLEKIKTAMTIDGFSYKDFEDENSKKKGRKWELDGKNFSEIHKEVENYKSYSYVYGALSEVIHSGWGDIRQLHLSYCEGDFFIPNLSLNSYNDIRIINSIISIMIEATESFLVWAERKDEVNFYNEYKKTNDLMTKLVLRNYEINPEKYMYE